MDFHDDFQQWAHVDRIGVGRQDIEILPGCQPRIGRTCYVNVFTGGESGDLSIDGQRFRVSDGEVVPIVLGEEKAYALVLFVDGVAVAHTEIIPTVVVPELIACSLPVTIDYGVGEVKFSVQANNTRQIGITYRRRNQAPWVPATHLGGNSFSIPLTKSAYRLSVQITLQSEDAHLSPKAERIFESTVAVVHPAPEFDLLQRPPNRQVLCFTDIAVLFAYKWAKEVTVLSGGRIESSRGDEAEGRIRIRVDTSKVGEVTLKLAAKGLDNAPVTVDPLTLQIAARPVTHRWKASEGRLEIEGSTKAYLEVSDRPGRFIQIPENGCWIQYHVLSATPALVILFDDDGKAQRHNITIEPRPYNPHERRLSS